MPAAAHRAVGAAGAAFGAKLAAPDRDVVLATGDGYFMFGTPMPALWSAAHYKAPFLTVVFVNRSYTTGTNGLKRSYPNGVAVRTENYEGGVFDPPPDFAKLAEAGQLLWADGARAGRSCVRRSSAALEQVRKGTPALVAAYLPTLVEEMSFAQRESVSVTVLGSRFNERCSNRSTVWRGMGGRDWSVSMHGES